MRILLFVLMIHLSIQTLKVIKMVGEEEIIYEGIEQFQFLEFSEWYEETQYIEYDQFSDELSVDQQLDLKAILNEYDDELECYDEIISVVEAQKKVKNTEQKQQLIKTDFDLVDFSEEEFIDIQAQMKEQQIPMDETLQQEPQPKQFKERKEPIKTKKHHKNYKKHEHKHEKKTNKKKLLQVNYYKQ
ncbi:hypothetical protein pb186bvf_002900 [Paramecium bursaria]